MHFFRLSLAWQMVIGSVLGILVGLFLGDLSIIFAPWASAYVMLMKITAIPYLICAIIHGVGLLSGNEAMRILKKGAIFVGIAWVINICMIYLISYLFPKAEGAKPTGFIAQEVQSIDFAELLIPENIFYALSNNILPAVVVFSLLIGISLIHLKDKQVILRTLDTLVESLTSITGWLSRITPIGTFLIIANQTGTIQLDTVKQVSTYLILYIAGICFLVFWIFPRIVGMLTPISASQWVKMLFPILLLAYTTNLVIVCLPYIIQMIQKVTDELFPKEEKAQTQTQGIVSIIFNLPLGSLFITVFIFFLSIFFNTPLPGAAQVKLFLTTFLTGLGAVGLGSWINTLNFLLDTLGLPLDSVNLYLITLPFTSGFQSLISVMEIASLSFFIVLACRRLIKFKWMKIASVSLIIVVPLVIIALFLKRYNPLPKIYNERVTIYDCNIPIEVGSAVFTTAPASTPSQEEVFDQILKRGVLRVGYNPNVPPFCFYNHQNQLVGYDMAFAYQLASDLNCSLEFIPMGYGTLIEDLENNIYDIAMSAVSITEDRLKQIYFTKPYLDAKIVFVVKDKRRKEFYSAEKIAAHPNIRVGVLKNSSFQDLASEKFPNNEIVPLESYECLEESAADVLLWEEQEAISWALQHPHCHVVFPNPLIGTDSLGYAMKAKNPRLLNYMNQWLKLKENEGFTEKQYNLWILGQTEANVPKPRRWSIIRDVLHWVK